MRTAISCSVTGSNTVSEGADLGEMVGGGAFALERLSNLVVKVRREVVVVDTEVLRLDFQRRFQNVVYDTPEPAWICALRFYCI